MWSLLHGSFLCVFVYCFAHLITSENSVQPHYNFSFCVQFSLISVGGSQSKGTTCDSGVAPTDPKDSWNYAISLKVNQDLD